MKQKYLLLCLLGLLSLSGKLTAQPLDRELSDTRVIDLPEPTNLPDVDATAWALMEMNSGWIVAGNNIQQPLPPASITKLMTNYVVFEKLKSTQISLDDQVSISEKAWRAEGSRMFADVNSKVGLKHLLKSTIIQSGNDAAIAMAEHIGGTEQGFAVMMNRAGKQLGLQDSNFVNSTGLPAIGHSMSAKDIVTLSAAIIAQYPEFYSWYAEKTYTHNDITQYNRNKLLWKDTSVDGLKTGHTNDAGFCLVGSALRDNQRWIVVVMGSSSESSRESAVLSLLDYAYANYQPALVLDQQGGITSVKVFQGEVNALRLQTIRPVNIVVPNGRKDDINVEFMLSPHYLPPIILGDPMGVATLSLDEKLLIEVPLVAMSSINQGSIWKRLKDKIIMQLQSL